MALSKSCLTYMGIIATMTPYGVDDTYSKLFKGKPLGPAANVYIDYTTVAKKKQVGDYVKREETGTKGKLQRGSYSDFQFEPPVIVSRQSFDPSDLLKVKAGEMIYFNGTSRKAEDSYVEDTLQEIKNAIAMRQENANYQVAMTGKFYDSEGALVKDYGLDAATAKTWDATHPFLEIMRQELFRFRLNNGKNPDVIKIGTTIIEHLMKDTVFTDQVYKLGLAKLTTDNAEFVIANVFGKNLEMHTTVTMVDDGVSVADAGMYVHMYNTDRLHKSWAGLTYVNGEDIEIVRTDLLVRTFVDPKAKTKEIIGESAYAPVLSDKNAIQRTVITKA
jgi:hypothetical protein